MSYLSSIRRLEDRLGHSFARPELLCLALTHSSFANEVGNGQQHNERLEFLGDAVLELCVSSELFRRFPDAREGELTKIRARLVSEGSLAEMAREIGLDRLVKLGRGEDAQGGRKRDSVLSDVFEAVLAAVYEDGGFEAALGMVSRLFAPCRFECAASGPQPRDFKSRLQEAMQRLFRDKPMYTRLTVCGPEHKPAFDVLLTLPDGREFTAGGGSCKKAEQQAARLALAALESGDGAPY